MIWSSLSSTYKSHYFPPSQVLLSLSRTLLLDQPMLDFFWRQKTQSIWRKNFTYVDNKNPKPFYFYLLIYFSSFFSNLLGSTYVRLLRRQKTRSIRRKNFTYVDNKTLNPSIFYLLIYFTSFFSNLLDQPMLDFLQRQKTQSIRRKNFTYVDNKNPKPFYFLFTYLFYFVVFKDNTTF